MSWSNSTRRSRLPRDWPHRRAIVLKRDPTCQLRYPDICTTTSTEVDHVKAGDDHQMTNLQGVCHPCHQQKTILERRPPVASRKRTPEPHPGLR